jgi:protein TonB
MPPITLPTLPGSQYEPFELDQVLAEVPLAIPTPGPAVTPQPPSPSPSASFTPSGARPRNDSGGWITTDDYPAAPPRRGIEGTTAYRLGIATSGRVSTCEITASSGDAQLDAATCKFITRRARFEPAADGKGAPVTGTYSGTVLWQIPR